MATKKTASKPVTAPKKETLSADDAEKVADAVAQEAKPAAKIDTSPKDDNRSVTGRPNDIPISKPQPAPLGGNSTFASRARGANKKVDPADTTSK